MRLRFLKYATGYFSIAILFLSLILGGKRVWIAPVYIFVLIPLVEHFLPRSTANMTAIEEEMAKKDRVYDIIIWFAVPVQLIMLFFFLNRVSDGTLTWWELTGMILTFGIACSVIGINVAHELGHRHTWYEQTMAKMLLLTSLYMHFYIEHNRGHHKNVSTDEDPASAKYGESLYAFFIRSVRDSWFSAWHLENQRLKKDKQSFWSFHNEMLVFQMIQMALLALIFFVWGWKTMLFFIVSATIGFLLLETVNYIEHYGLRRKKTEGEYYERTMPVHSWNSDHPIGRIMLFELTRHSDHHYMTSRKYQVLRHFDNSPQMPSGYAAMMLMAFCPPLWFSVMNKQIEKYKATPFGQALA